jgi:Flp pilus assembly protein TadG
MRMALNRPQAKAERGAAAVLTALMSVVILLMAAFSVDLGLAYNIKRQLSTAADAGALAAAQVYAQNYQGSCNSTFINTYRGAAQIAANDVGGANWPAGSSPLSINPVCVSDGLEVTYETQNDVDTAFGKVAGVSSIHTTGAASARIKGPGGLRPWPICSNVVNTSQNVTFVPLKGGSTATGGDPCGVAGPPGGWWVSQCTGQSNANGATELAVQNGCATGAYQAVPSQPTDPTARSTYLRNYCPSGSENNTCLASDNGNNFHNASEEWESLVGQTIQMPVACFPPQCTPAAYEGNGQNAAYAISAIATVEICGMKLNPRPASANWPTSGKCATNNPMGYTSDSVTSGAGIFLVIKGLSGSMNWQGDEVLTSVLLSR